MFNSLFRKLGTAAAVFITASAFVHAASAAPMLVTNGSLKVTGVTGLVVDGQAFDVTFSAGGLTYNAALTDLGISSFFDFGSYASAQAATFALATFFNSEAPDAQGGDMSWGTMDNNSDTNFRVWLNETLGGSDTLALPWIVSPGTWAAINTVEFVATGDPAPSFSAWASFTPVPAPGAGLLLSTGLLGLAALRRRERV